MKDDLFKGIEILIAEDNFTNYALLKELINLIGAEHFWAKNGEEVFDLLTKHENIALILMDINMPGMDGITVTRKIREKDKNIPIIFQTAYTTEENMEDCYSAGGNDFLSKPINREKLNNVLKKHLKI